MVTLQSAENGILTRTIESRPLKLGMIVGAGLVGTIEQKQADICPGLVQPGANLRFAGLHLLSAERA